MILAGYQPGGNRTYAGKSQEDPLSGPGPETSGLGVPVRRRQTQPDSRGALPTQNQRAHQGRLPRRAHVCYVRFLTAVTVNGVSTFSLAGRPSRPGAFPCSVGCPGRTAMTQSMERPDVSRRSFIGGVGITAGGLLVASSPVLWQQAAQAATVTAEQVHLTFGQDPAREVAVSWVTPTSVSNPTVMVGTAHGGFGRKIRAETRTYTDANNGIQTIAQHARIEGLRPDTDYVYRIVSDGETQLSSAFRTAPEGRVPFRFTSVGDIACGDTAFSKASLNAVATAASVERFDPVVHLVNGDLSYANSNQMTQPQVWEEYFDNTQLSAKNRPWMPTLGNHENEPGNGPQGYLSYQTRFALPRNYSGDFEGNWYSFQIGSVLFVMLDNNDVCYQVDTGTFLSSGDNQILTGYSGGRQLKWLEKTLREASTARSVDWIVAVMHQPPMSPP